MNRSIRTRIARFIAVSGLATVAVVGSSGVAFAQQDAGGTVRAGEQLCTAKQYANTQVRGFLENASGQGVKLKLYKGGTVVANSPDRVPSGTVQELPPTFSGPGYYQFCVNNTGTAQSTVSGMHLYTDAEVH